MESCDNEELTSSPGKNSSTMLYSRQNSASHLFTLTVLSNHANEKVEMLLGAETQWVRVGRGFQNIWYQSSLPHCPGTSWEEGGDLSGMCWAVQVTSWWHLPKVEEGESSALKVIKPVACEDSARPPLSVICLSFGFYKTWRIKTSETLWRLVRVQMFWSLLRNWRRSFITCS